MDRNSRLLQAIQIIGCLLAMKILFSVSLQAQMDNQQSSRHPYPQEADKIIQEEAEEVKPSGDVYSFQYSSSQVLGNQWISP